MRSSAARVFLQQDPRPAGPPPPRATHLPGCSLVEALAGLPRVRLSQVLAQVGRPPSRTSLLEARPCAVAGGEGGARAENPKRGV